MADKLEPHHYLPSPGPAHGAYGEVVDAHCRDNQRRDRADRRYLLVEPSPVRERARSVIKALLSEGLARRAPGGHRDASRARGALW